MSQSGSEDRSELGTSKPHKLFITGMDGKIQIGQIEAELKKKFSKYGQLVSVVAKKSYNHEYTFAFIDYKEDVDATTPMKNENNSTLCGAKITVTIQDNSRRKKGVANGCYNCGKPGHFARDCKNKKEQSEERSSSKHRSRTKKHKKRRHSSDDSHSPNHSLRKKQKKKRSKSRGKKHSKSKKSKKQRKRSYSYSD